MTTTTLNSTSINTAAYQLAFGLDVAMRTSKLGAANKILDNLDIIAAVGQINAEKGDDTTSFAVPAILTATQKRQLSPQLVIESALKHGLLDAARALLNKGLRPQACYKVTIGRTKMSVSSLALVCTQFADPQAKLPGDEDSAASGYSPEKTVAILQLLLCKGVTRQPDDDRYIHVVDGGTYKDSPAKRLFDTHRPPNSAAVKSPRTK
jgi:hypothetical protein